MEAIQHRKDKVQKKKKTHNSKANTNAPYKNVVKAIAQEKAIEGKQGKQPHCVVFPLSE